MEVTGSKTQVDLAIILGVRQASISEAKNRGSIPDSWYFKLMRSHGLNPLWLADGVGPKYLPSVDSDDETERDPDNVLVWNRHWILDRFMEVLKIETDEALAALLKVPADAIAGARQHRIPPQWALAVADISGIPLKSLLEVDALPWEFDILFGWLDQDDRDSKTDSIAKSLPEPWVDVYIPAWSPPDFSYFKFIPMAESELSAGGEAFVLSKKYDELFAFHKNWLINKATYGRSVVLMTVKGDSMEPIIIDGDVVMIDKGRKSVHDGYIYALGIGETISIKRLYLLPNGCCRVRSDNPEFESYEVDLKEIRILGQVIWRAGRPSFSPPHRQISTS